jgi:hypothetical protein
MMGHAKGARSARSGTKGVLAATGRVAAETDEQECAMSLARTPPRQHFHEDRAACAPRATAELGVSPPVWLVAATCVILLVGMQIHGG